ncbi:MAG: GHKL domain-containing protein [Lachnospiraceae bacterium]|nr:GHKL domain-containing protein [Lachnospiraceae bacterium]
MTTLFIYIIFIKVTVKKLLKESIIPALLGFLTVNIVESVLLAVATLLGFELTAFHPINLTTFLLFFVTLPILNILFKKTSLRKLASLIKSPSSFIIAILFVLTTLTVSTGALWLVPESELSSSISNRLIVGVSFTFLFLLILEEQSERRKNESLHYYETYLPIVEEMIKNVQITQHSMKNQIMSIKGLVSTDASETDVKNTLQNLTNNPSYSVSIDYTFLYLDNKLLAGLLCQKMTYAKNHGKMLHYKIRQYSFSSALNDFDLIDVVGILIDNAIEHSTDEDIYITIGQPENSDISDFYIEIENADPKATPEYIKQMFKKDHTFKKERRGHGYRMHILKNKINKNNGSITIENTIKKDTLMLKIIVEV